MVSTEDIIHETEMDKRIFISYLLRNQILIVLAIYF